MAANDMEIGEVREWDGKRYKAEEALIGICDMCAFDSSSDLCAASDAFLGRCSASLRKDGKHVFFKVESK